MDMRLYLPCCLCGGFTSFSQGLNYLPVFLLLSLPLMLHRIQSSLIVLFCCLVVRVGTEISEGFCQYFFSALSFQPSLHAWTTCGALPTFLPFSQQLTYLVCYSGPGSWLGQMGLRPISVLTSVLLCLNLKFKISQCSCLSSPWKEISVFTVDFERERFFYSPSGSGPLLSLLMISCPSSRER